MTTQNVIDLLQSLSIMALAVGAIFTTLTIKHLMRKP